MTITLRCPHCLALLEVQEAQPGRVKACPACGGALNAAGKGLQASQALAGMAPPRTLADRLGRLHWLAKAALLTAALALPVAGLVGWQAWQASSAPRPKSLATPTPKPTADPPRAAESLAARLAGPLEPGAFAQALLDLGSVPPAEALAAVLTPLSAAQPGLSAQGERQLLRAVATLAQRGHRSAEAITQAARRLDRPAVWREAGLALASLQDQRGVSWATQQLIRVARERALAAALGHRTGDPLSQDLLAQARLLHTALGSAGPAAWREMLPTLWDCWAWVGGDRERLWLDELDAVRAAALDGRAALQAVAANLESPDVRLALAAAAYLHHVERPGLERRAELASFAVLPALSDKPDDQRLGAWCLAKLFDKQFGSFDAQLPPQRAGPEAIAACQAWARKTFQVRP